MSDTEPTELVDRLSAAPTLGELPDVVDLSEPLPANPPPAIQTQFVGRSYHEAYAEAEAFVGAVDRFCLEVMNGGIGGQERVVDFGSGWGRISRLLLDKVGATHIYALDVDPKMTALVNTTLPGLNAMTTRPLPPTVIGSDLIDVAVAFSVFSHLSGAAHEAWATEFGRIIRPGGIIAITVLERDFLQTARAGKEAVAAGSTDSFATSMAELFEDVDAAEAAFDRGEIQYAGVGGGDVRTGDFYGWAAAPRAYVEKHWGAAGFDLVQWLPTGSVVSQAVVLMRRRPDPTFVSVARAHAGALIRPVRARLARELHKRRSR